MDRRAMLKGLAGLTAAGLLPRRAGAQGRRPNVLFILIDDMGWADLTCYGSTFYRTPHTDRLASQGMRFTDAYAACPVCSPTRASILTGQYPARLHLTDWITGHKRPKAKLKVPDWTMYLDHEQITLAEMFKPLGYATCSIGKWHLGDEEYYPETQGFDTNLGGNHRGSPPSYFSPYKIPQLPDGPDREYLTDRLTDEAIGWIEQQGDQPWFLYLPHYAVHTPIQAKKEMTAEYEARIEEDNPQTNAKYAAMVQSVDESVGRLMDTLDRLKLADDTIVFFMSDNGGLERVTSNKPLRAGKGTPYEGGVREPLIVRWPGHIEPGTVNREIVTSIDFFPTILDLVGAPEAGRPKVDGLTMAPVLAGTGHMPERPIYWHYPHYHIDGMFGSVRDGDWKLIERFETGQRELYNLKDDLSEAHDLAAQQPAQVARLYKLLTDWRQEVGAQMPTPNPDYDPDAK